MRRIVAIVACTLVLVMSHVASARASEAPEPMRSLRIALRHLAARLPAATAAEVLDLSTGYRAGYNAAESMPAASTIKVPVMVEVFRQLEEGKFDLNRRVMLMTRDKDYGSGDLCDAPVGTTYPVSELLSKMIDISDNTASNMLIRLVGRRNINRTMANLGLEHTWLTSDVHTSTWSIRNTLRTSPHDMVRLLALMARHELVDEWSSNEMISILEGDEINTLLPEPLPQDVPIAHKTGSFFDTLNDVGIVFEAGSPYVIAVMTTHLPSLSAGRTFIRSLSRAAFVDEARLAEWRDETGFQSISDATPVSAPDVRYWSSAIRASGAGGG